MSKDLTEQVLRILWNGEEVPGVTAYGYWNRDIIKNPIFPLEAWPNGTLFKKGELSGPHWNVLLWDIRIMEWPTPDKWEGTLKATLQAMIEAGGQVAWFGLEGHFADPPHLFDPKEMSGGVYAILSPELGFKCTAYLGRSFNAVLDDELLRLKTLILS